MVVLPPEFAFHTFGIIIPWKTSISKFDNRDLIASEIHQGGASGWFVRLISFAMSRNHVTKWAVMGCEFARFPTIMLLEIYFKS